MNSRNLIPGWFSVERTRLRAHSAQYCFLSLSSIMTAVRGEKDKCSIPPRVEGLSASLCFFAHLSSDGGANLSISKQCRAALAGVTTNKVHSQTPITT